MYTEGFEQWFKTNKNLSTPLNEWNKTCTEMCKRVTQQNLEIIGENASRFSDRLRRFSGMRKPEDLLNVQKDFLNEDLTTSIECMQKCIHNTMENMEELTDLWKSLFGSLQEATTHNMMKTAEKAEKSAK